MGTLGEVGAPDQNCKGKLELSLKSWAWSLKFIQFCILPIHVYFNMKIIFFLLQNLHTTQCSRRMQTGVHNPVSSVEGFEEVGIQNLHAFGTISS